MVWSLEAHISAAELVGGKAAAGIRGSPPAAAHDDRCCVLRLYHEELCAEPARVLRRVVDFLGVPSTDADIAAMLRRAAVSRRCAGGRSAGGLPPAEHAFEYAGRKLKEGS